MNTTTIISILNELHSSQAPAAMAVPSIYQLYKEMREVLVGDDLNLFESQSAPVMEQIERKTFTRNELVPYLSFCAQFFGSQLAVALFRQNLIPSPDDLETILDFFWNFGLPGGIAEYGVVACAKQLGDRDPARSYELTISAFQSNPDLTQIMGKSYRYSGKATQSHITENCPFCGSNDAVPFYCSPQYTKLSEGSVFPPAKLWMRCRHCKNFYTYDFPLPDISDINGHYTRRDDSRETIKAHFSLSIYDAIFSRFRQFTNGNRYLEIGIGNGEMLAIALEYGFDVSAVEICREDCEKVSSVLGVDVAWSDIVTYETDKTYDVIVLGDVLEHVSDPLAVLRKVSTMLAPKGIVWISTPNYNCAYARMEKFSHAMWHELNHYTYMSFDTLRSVLENLGLTVLDYHLSSRYIGSMEVIGKKG